MAAGARKIGRTKKKCERYRASGRREKNKARRLEARLRKFPAISAEFEGDAAPTITSETIKECHGCDGKGRVEVGDSSVKACADCGKVPDKGEFLWVNHDPNSGDDLLRCCECSPGVRRRR